MNKIKNIDERCKYLEKNILLLQNKNETDLDVFQQQMYILHESKLIEINYSFKWEVSGVKSSQLLNDLFYASEKGTIEIYNSSIKFKNNNSNEIQESKIKDVLDLNPDILDIYSSLLYFDNKLKNFDKAIEALNHNRNKDYIEEVTNKNINWFYLKLNKYING